MFSIISLFFLSFFSFISLASSSSSCSASTRTDCGYNGITASQCLSRGCCWIPESNEPWCFYPPATVPVWSIKSDTELGSTGVSLILSTNNRQGNYGLQPSELSLICSMDSDSRFHVRIFDSNNSRWEIPPSIIQLNSPQPIETPAISFQFSGVGEPLRLSVTRLSDNATIFNLGDLQFSDQYLVISNIFSSENSPMIFGLGERIENFQLPIDSLFTLFNSDSGTPVDQNLYGSHPFYLELSENGNAHGFYLHNSNGLDVSFNAEKIQWRAIGGILDFYLFAGPTPEQVLKQYHQLIGLPHLPPYWALGWHQCRWGYKNISEVKSVVENYAKSQIPLDTMWNDIDYMAEFKDFTWDPINYPVSEVSEFASFLHSNGQRYVVIVDPGIHVEVGYSPYDVGLSLGIFIFESDGSTPVVGRVWPNSTVFPDFSNPKSLDYWRSTIENFLAQVPVDGLWIDMNEISNFLDGSPSSNSPVNNPPYAINNRNYQAPLNTKTLPMDAIHFNGVQEYNIHNLYGLTEAIATKYALETIKKKRSFILSRSTFASSGVHTAHWLGDNTSKWADLAASIPGILNFNMFGIPLVGADICGFNGDTTEELCNRWTALGSFYPFSRNHNTKGASPQEPYLWSSVTETARRCLSARYSLLPYLYSLFSSVHLFGGSVARPLFFEFPLDSSTWSLDSQFLLGPALMISPVLTAGATSLSVYFPDSVWFDYWTGLSQSVGSHILATPLTHIQVHVRGGFILPQQIPQLTTKLTRESPFFLTVALDENGDSQGELYWDDGESLDSLDCSLDCNYLLAKFVASSGSLSSSILQKPRDLEISLLESIRIWGVKQQPTVSVNGQKYQQENWNWNQTSQILNIFNLTLSIDQTFTVGWN